MKRILIVVMVFALVSSLAVMVGCSKAKDPQAKEEPVSEKIAPIPKKKDNSGGLIKKEASGKEEVIDLGNGVKLGMILIPAGKFMMGSPANEKGREKVIKELYETQHEVTLTKSFYMGKYEVTQEQWESVMGNKSTSKAKGAKLPVHGVSWNDCQDFIKKLNTKTNSVYRLPTEAEWEYACRAGTTTAYSFGDSLTKNDANIYGPSIKPVGSYKPNAFGLYDMHGNAEEWCEDGYAPYPNGAVTDPKGPETGLRAIMIRGGAFNDVASKARSSSRNFFTPSGRYVNGGFRLARTP